MDDISARVIGIVSKQMGVAKDQVTPATKLVDDLGVDSLDTVELTMEIEEAFDITLPDEDAATLLTVGDIIEYVKDPWIPDDDDEVPVAVPPVGGFVVDPEKRREVERKAVILATRWYEKQGWTVRSVERERDRVGYDLHCTRGDRAVHVEVKGTAGPDEAFNITEAEKRRAEVDPLFRLAIVTDALGDAELAIYRGAEALGRFTFTPIVYKAKRRDASK